MTRASFLVAFAGLAALARDAGADAKTQELATGYDKELAACKRSGDGQQKVIDRAKAMIAGAPDESVTADLEELSAAHGVVQGYCDELSATIALIRADPKASYRSLEKQLDDHDNKIRALRRTSKKALDDSAPMISRLIPKINARAGTADTKPTRTPAAFPSGHGVKLPSWPGTWKLSGSKANDVAEYTEGTAATTLGVRAFSGATCEQQEQLISKKTDGGAAFEKAAPKGDAKPAASALPWLAGAHWKASYTSTDRYLQVECVAGKAGGYVITLDTPDKARLERDLGELATQMLAVQTEKP